MIAAPAFASSVAGALFCLKIAGVLVPALILYEILAPLPLFARWGGWLGPRLAPLGMSSPCALPLAAGLFLGIAYGAGIIIPMRERRDLGTDEIQSVGLFLVNCHAVLEDTLLFSLVGSRGPGQVLERMAVLGGVRLALALGVARVRYLRVRRLRGTRPGSRGPW